MRKGTDIEVYLELFLVTFEDYITREKTIFEISFRKNQLGELKQYYNTQIDTAITFNGIDYDDIILAYVCSLGKELSWKVITELAYKCSAITMNKEKDWNTFKNKYGKFRFDYPYEQLDIFRYWSKLARRNKKIGLKSLGCQLGLSIQETPVPFDKIALTSEDIDNIIGYNGNDTFTTIEVVKAKKDEVNLRQYAKEEYGFDCLSWDGVKLGYSLALQLLSERNNIPVDELQKRRTVREQVVLDDIILPFIKFEENDNKRWVEKIDKDYYYCFKTFGALLKHLKQQTVKNTKEIKCRVYYKDTVYDIKSGGIHSAHENDLVICGQDEIYEDSDVASYYPRVISAYGFVPEHFKGLGMEEIIEEKRQQRVLIKVSNPKKAELYKLMLNGGIFGNMNNAFTAMQDLQAFLSVTINGQLMLLMLAEQCELNSIHVDMINTDGITVLMKKDKHELYRKLCRDWEQLTKMDLEHVQYDKVVRKNINNYMALYKKDGKKITKKKGKYFKNKLELSDSNDFFVIPKAVEAYFKDGVKPEEFVAKHEDILDFCASHKIAKSYDVIYRNEKIQQLNRYFVSKEGAYLYKQARNKTNKKKKKVVNPNQLDMFGISQKVTVKKEEKGNLEAVMKGVPITILNEATNKKASEYNIDRNFYLVKIREKLLNFESNQTKLS